MQAHDAAGQDSIRQISKLVIGKQERKMGIKMSEIKEFGAYSYAAAILTNTGAGWVNWGDGWKEINAAEFWKPGGSDNFTAWDDLGEWIECFKEMLEIATGE